MRRRAMTLAALVVLVLIGLIHNIVMGAHVAERIYTPAQLATLRQRNPRMWNGRTVLVRGWLERTGPTCLTHVRCVYPGWMIIRGPCPRSSRCSYASLDMIGSRIPHVGWDYNSALIVAVSQVPEPFPSLNQIILHFFGGLAFIDQHVHDTGSIYRVRLLPKVACKKPTIIVPFDRAVCQPDARRL